MNIPSVAPDVQKSLRHYQKCLVALEKIASIDGQGPIGAIAKQALMNEPLRVEGTSLDG